ncbi:hypothetical protein [Fictibacillus phosphorivorans]|uniref:hypothetical protein n=1 Tax=Fictibacillus phosphorivorans TaxID=1221500 RepID=UPI0020419128|nr:hypothetical protein [Fictibacillus phosphorivorans]MCM3720159.1 hypothetical protein [Fictibacillus phosphorivorans]MCM3777849.1 hypothetical protein [Fictibacillus phosphorivorans]
MSSISNTFKQAELTKYDYMIHIAFAVLLCLYSFLLLFANKMLGFLFFIVGLLLLGTAVWKGIKPIFSITGVTVMLGLLFYSRILWFEALQILPLFFYEIFQVLFFLGTGLGIALLYRLAVKSAPLTSPLNRHIIHGIYFLTAILLMPYTIIVSYGAFMQGEVSGVFWSILILLLWGILYTVQLITNKNKLMRNGLFVLNICMGWWTINRWIMILS